MLIRGMKMKWALLSDLLYCNHKMHDEDVLVKDVPFSRLCECGLRRYR